MTEDEKELLRISESFKTPVPGRDPFGPHWDAYCRLQSKVQAKRKAAGHLLWPQPPIARPPKRPGWMPLVIRHFSAPDYDQRPIIEVDAAFEALCEQEAILDLLRSPGFAALPLREQLAALFDRWPQTQSDD